MREKLRSEAGRKIYSKRARSAEAPFATIKQALGYRQFLRRGLRAVSEECTLVCRAYNAKRLCALTAGRLPARE
ncbi:MAG: transposase [Spirochaetales bacterium]